ncbi:hypothetical protein [Bradyrhizobium australafricanum]|uniref:hypothetical protein n=1 Tax=Bradyrhizobium australafricanum TaxID=2821406 RepID=UPI001CE36B66|nr:hypothetical protein [Bradyrhizobium australafricanum]MCA6104027.1 hypothetical protein [Bradyrhizobium australafricanum]
MCTRLSCQSRQDLLLGAAPADQSSGGHLACHRAVDIFQNHHVASQARRSKRSRHVTLNEHTPIPSASRQYDAGQLDQDGSAECVCLAMPVERLMRERPYSEQYFYFATSIIALRDATSAIGWKQPARGRSMRFSGSSVSAVFKAGLDHTSPRRARRSHAFAAPASVAGYYQ